MADQDHVRDLAAVVDQVQQEGAGFVEGPIGEGCLGRSPPSVSCCSDSAVERPLGVSALVIVGSFSRPARAWCRGRLRVDVLSRA